MIRGNKWLFSLCLLTCAVNVWAWGDKGHQLINRAAAKGMPADTPDFFKKAIDRLAYLGPEPDRWRDDRNNSADDDYFQLYNVTAPDHFIDMEYAQGIDYNAPLNPSNPKSTPRSSRYNFMLAVSANLDRLEKEKKFTKFDRSKFNIENVGFLPYRITELTMQLRKHWLKWRDPKTTAEEKANLEQNIIYIAGVLGHYVGDGSNPHHTTVHYNGWDSDLAPNVAGYVGKGKSFHFRFEDEFVEAKVDSEAAAKVESMVKAAAPATFKDPFDKTLSYLTATHTQLIALYELEKKTPFNKNNASSTSLAFTTDRLGKGAIMLRDLWAWAMQP